MQVCNEHRTGIQYHAYLIVKISMFSTCPLSESRICSLLSVKSAPSFRSYLEMEYQKARSKRPYLPPLLCCSRPKPSRTGRRPKVLFRDFSRIPSRAGAAPSPKAKGAVRRGRGGAKEAKRREAGCSRLAVLEVGWSLSCCEARG